LLGDLQLKGFSRPVPTYSVLGLAGERQASSRTQQSGKHT
jgi:hypothetical protein